MVVDEGSDVSLRCVATGSPKPSILWKREDGEEIFVAGETGTLNYFKYFNSRAYIKFKIDNV